MTPDTAAERIVTLISEEQLDFEAVIAAVREKRDERIAEVDEQLAAARRTFGRSTLDFSNDEVSYWSEQKTLRRLAA